MSRSQIDKTSMPGHWVLSGTTKVRQRRRKEYQIAYGELSRRIHVTQGCSVPNCVNPECTVKRAARPDSLVYQAKELYETGMSVNQVALAIKRSNGYTRNLLIDAGLRLADRRFWNPTPEQAARADMLIREGLPDRWVAEDLGCSTGTVRKIRAALGIDADEWMRVQLACRKIKALAPLHDMFNPGKGIAG